MNQNPALTLDEHDPLVLAALEAERRLFAFYGLEAKTHTVRLPGLGLRLRISEVGAGKPVLVVPGNAGEAFPLIPLMAQLPGRRILAVNRPGAGGSEGFDYRQVNFRQFVVDSLVSVLDAFELEKVPIVAHSIGGHISLWMAMDKPERVGALTLLGVPGNIINTRPPMFLRWLAVPRLNQLLYNLVLRGGQKQPFRGLSMVGHSPETLARLPRALAECYASFQKLPHARVTTLSMMEKTNRESNAIRIHAGQLKGVSQPALFLWGTQDPFGSIETGRQIAQCMPAAQLHAIQGGGHLPWLDSPAECGQFT